MELICRRRRDSERERERGGEGEGAGSGPEKGRELDWILYVLVLT